MVARARANVARRNAYAHRIPIDQAIAELEDYLAWVARNPEVYRWAGDPHVFPGGIVPGSGPTEVDRPAVGFDVDGTPLDRNGYPTRQPTELELRALDGDR